jgi:tetratricopeptide (TPR) repeat protein
LAVNPRSAVAEQNLLVMAMDAGRAVEAVRRATRLKELAPDEPTTWFNLGSALAVAHRYQDAADTYRQAIARWPSRVEGYGGLAAALIDLDRPAEALQQYDAALRIDPNNATLRALRNKTAVRLSATQPNP